MIECGETILYTFLETCDKDYLDSVISLVEGLIADNPLVEILPSFQILMCTLLGLRYDSTQSSGDLDKGIRASEKFLSVNPPTPCSIRGPPKSWANQFILPAFLCSLVSAMSWPRCGSQTITLADRLPGSFIAICLIPMMKLRKDNLGQPIKWASFIHTGA